MGDTKRREEWRRQVLGDLFGTVPSTETIAGLVRESNYDKLVNLAMDVLKSHGQETFALLMKTFEIDYPKEYEMYQRRLAEDRQLVYTTYQKPQQKAPVIETIDPTEEDYKKLLTNYVPNGTNNREIYQAWREIGNAFLIKTGYVDIAQYYYWADSDPELPKHKFPENWPWTMKQAACYGNLQAALVKADANLPEHLKGQNENEYGLMLTNLCKGLCILEQDYERSLPDD
jgi:Txe/YoeB family toxin of Txe-Axe toxin-antitoxin module